ncbi:MAG: sigma 54-interacting transcriptional regulator [Campylobacterales bacterium]
MTQRPFIAASNHLQEIKRLVTLLSGVRTNILITGEIGTGKSFIAKQISPQAVIADGANLPELLTILNTFNEVIIENFDAITNYDQITLEGRRLIAITTRPIRSAIVDRFFGMTIELLPLRDHPEDILPLSELFLQELQESYGITASLPLSHMKLDISQNAHSLRQSIAKELLLSTLTHDEIETLLERFIATHAKGEADYDRFLALFDRAMIRAMYRLHRSQLSMAAHMGINRNTLRKKIKELGIYLEDSHD